MNAPDRLNKAETYKKKVPETFTAADVCRDSKKYRAACNRAYYGVFQLLNYALLKHTSLIPTTGKPHFSHDNVELHLEKLAVAMGQRQPYNATATSAEKKRLTCLKTFREVADYMAKRGITDDDMTPQAAQDRIDDACSVRQFICKLIGESI